MRSLPKERACHARHQCHDHRPHARRRALLRGAGVDQYQVSTDARGGITTDPNRPDDPEYIVRLIKQVVTVSVETVRLVDELAASVDLLAAVGVKVEAGVEA